MAKSAIKHISRRKCPAIFRSRHLNTEIAVLGEMVVRQRTCVLSPFLGPLILRVRWGIVSFFFRKAHWSRLGRGGGPTEVHNIEKIQVIGLVWVKIASLKTEFNCIESRDLLFSHFSRFRNCALKEGETGHQVYSVWCQISTLSWINKGSSTGGQLKITGFAALKHKDLRCFLLLVRGSFWTGI